MSESRLVPRVPLLRPRARVLFALARDEPARDDLPLPLRDLDEDRLLEPLRV